MSIHVTFGRGSVLLWWHCDSLCTSGFMDDVMFSYNGTSRPESQTMLMFRPFHHSAAPGGWGVCCLQLYEVWQCVDWYIHDSFLLHRCSEIGCLRDVDNHIKIDIWCYKFTVADGWQRWCKVFYLGVVFSLLISIELDVWNKHFYLIRFDMLINDRQRDVLNGKIFWRTICPGSDVIRPCEFQWLWDHGRLARWSRDHNMAWRHHLTYVGSRLTLADVPGWSCRWSSLSPPTLIAIGITCHIAPSWPRPPVIQPDSTRPDTVSGAPGKRARGDGESVRVQIRDDGQKSRRRGALGEIYSSGQWRTIVAGTDCMCVSACPPRGPPPS